MVLVAPFADVVVSSDSTSSSGRSTSPSRRAKRSRSGRGRLGQPLEVADRQQRVLVDRVLVVEVAHHAAGDRLELGKHLAEQPEVVHLRQPRVEPGPRLEKAAEARPCARRSERTPRAVNRPAFCCTHDSASSDTPQPASSAAWNSGEPASPAARAASRTSTNRMPSADAHQVGRRSGAARP